MGTPADWLHGLWNTLPNPLAWYYVHLATGKLREIIGLLFAPVASVAKLFLPLDAIMATTAVWLNGLWSTLFALLAYCIYHQRQATGKMWEILKTRFIPEHVLEVYQSISPQNVSLMSVVKSFLKCWLLGLLCVWLGLRTMVIGLLHRFPSIRGALRIFDNELEAVDRRHCYLKRSINNFTFSKMGDCK